jgi:3-deoxy-D-manno-octulosonate 8-phosphate phosphatase (KDO 8-P phosphatase)
VAVANAAPEIVRECRVQLTRAGGRGAVREFAELLLKARGEWDAVVARYVAERDAELEEASS